MSTSKGPIKTENKNVKDIYISFLGNLNSVNLFFERLSPMAETEDKTITDGITNYIDECFNNAFGKEAMEKFKNKKKEDDDYKLPELSNEKKNKFLNRLMKVPRIPAKNYDILVKGSFIILNNYFEYLFYDLLTYHFRKNPSAIGDKKISISIEELKEYSTIEEAYEDLISREVETLLIDMNFEGLKEFFFKKLKIDLEEKLVRWDFIAEVRERRNIIVHNNSIVNKRYIVKTDNQFPFKLDDIVTIDQLYFKNAHNEIKLAGLLLLLNCWGNWDKENTTEAISKILDLSFEELKNKNFEIVKKLGEYVDQKIISKNDKEDEMIYKIKFNYCISLKRLNLKEELKANLDKLKVGALSPIFKIAHKILNNDYDGAINLFEKSKVVDKLILDNYKEWPLFEELRLDETLNEFAISKF